MSDASIDDLSLLSGDPLTQQTGNMRHNLSLTAASDNNGGSAFVGGGLTSFALDVPTNTLYGAGQEDGDITFVSFDVGKQSSTVKKLAVADLDLYPGTAAIDSSGGSLFVLASERGGAVNLLTIDTASGDVASKHWCNDSTHATDRDRFSCGKSLFFV